MQCPECAFEVPFWRVVLVHLRLGGGRCSRCRTPFEPIFTLRACLIMAVIAGLACAAGVGLVWPRAELVIPAGVLGALLGGVLIPASLVQIRVYPLRRKRQGPSWMRRASGR